MGKGDGRPQLSSIFGMHRKRMSIGIALIVLVGVAAVLALLVFRPSQSKAEENAAGFLHAFYDGPDEAAVKDFVENNSRKLASEKYEPYLSEDFKDKFVMKYGLHTDMICYQTGAATTVKEIRTEVVEDRVEATVTVEAAGADGTKTDVTMLLLLHTDADGKINYFSLPANHRELMQALDPSLAGK